MNEALETHERERELIESELAEERRRAEAAVSTYPVRLLLDECSGARPLCEERSAAGHDVERSIEVLGVAASDERVLKHAIETSRVVLTMNCGRFLALVSDARAHPGLLLHYRGAKGGLAYGDIVRAVTNIESAYGALSGMVLALNQYAWKGR